MGSSRRYGCLLYCLLSSQREKKDTFVHHLCVYASASPHQLNLIHLWTRFKITIWENRRKVLFGFLCCGNYMMFFSTPHSSPPRNNNIRQTTKSLGLLCWMLPKPRAVCFVLEFATCKTRDWASSSSSSSNWVLVC